MWIHNKSNLKIILELVCPCFICCFSSNCLVFINLLHLKIAIRMKRIIFHVSSWCRNNHRRRQPLQTCGNWEHSLGCGDTLFYSEIKRQCFAIGRITRYSTPRSFLRRKIFSSGQKIKGDASASNSGPSKPIGCLFQSVEASDVAVIASQNR